MRTAVVFVFASLLLGGAALAVEYEPAVEKFQACENKAGAGIFWVDTTTGRTWWADPHEMEWKFFGQPRAAAPGPKGTYIPFENKSGEGLFVLNTATGEGWWTDGKQWKSLGRPRIEAVAAPE